MNMGVQKNNQDSPRLESSPRRVKMVDGLRGETEGCNKSSPVNIPAGSKSPKSPRKKARNWWYRYYRGKEANLKKKHGARQARRYDNWNFLLELGENEELGELELADLMEPTVSAFAELLMQNDKMEIWNDFINHPEEEQEKLLKGCCNHGDEKEKEKATESGDEDGDTDSWEVVEDKRAVHPAFPAEACFERIDLKLRKLLKKKQLPMGILQNLEEDVTEFFKEWPQSVMVSQLPSSYERLLLHALCQYLNLFSYSYDDEKGARQTQVENRETSFTLPEQSLASFLEERL